MRTKHYVSWEAQARNDLGLDRPAIKVDSAECDHYDYFERARWSREVDRALLRLLT